jgi:tetratricopeptide (TPR) repeat protein
MDADHWQQRYADKRTLVFSWSGLNKSWELNAAGAELNRQAFGEIPADKRPPLRGAPPPHPPGFWTLYLDGVPPTPALVGECYLQRDRFMAINELMSLYSNVGSLFMRLSQMISGTAFTLSPALESQLRSAQAPPLVDFRPAALPILMVRGARRAVAENPLDAESYKVLMYANETLRGFQEDYWAGFQRSPLRERLRQTQLVASAYHVVQLQPDNPEFHENLAKIYLQKNFFDLALDHLQQAYKAREARLASGQYGPRTPKEKEAALKNYREKNVDSLEQTVRLRLAKYKEDSDKLPPLQKVTNALHLRFQEFGEKGKEETPLGLGKKALEVLLEIDQKSLKEEEQLPYLVRRFDLLLDTGRVDIVADDLKHENVRNALPPVLLAQYELFAAGAVGDYIAMDEALALIEQQQREGIRLVGEEIKRRRTRCAPSMVLAPLQHCATGLIAGVTQTLPTHWRLNESLLHLSKAHNDLFNTKTLRGIVALEAGDTNDAREIFQTTLREAGSEHFFSDRPIARRYLDLLNQQR